MNRADAGFVTGLARFLAMGRELRPRYSRSLPDWYTRRSRDRGPLNRDQERERRRRQIERGQLREENGLVRRGDRGGGS